MDVAKSLKTLAKILAGLYAVSALIWGASELEWEPLIGIVIILAGILISVITFLLLYALGEIVEKLNDIDEHISQCVNNSYEIFKKMDNTQN